MTEECKRLFDPGISQEERDLRCFAAYGKPFSKVADKLRLAELKRGVKARDYLILSASEDGTGVMEVEFACMYSSDLTVPGMLYEQVSGGLHEPFRFIARLTQPRSKKWVVDMIRRASDPDWRLRRRRAL